MALRIIVCLIVFAAVLIADWGRIGRCAAKTRVIYILLMGYALYTGIGFVRIDPLPNLYDGVSVLLSKTGEVIDVALKAPPREEPVDSEEGNGNGD